MFQQQQKKQICKQTQMSTHINNKTNLFKQLRKEKKLCIKLIALPTLVNRNYKRNYL